MLSNWIAIEKAPFFVKLAQTVRGKLFLLSVFTLLILETPVFKDIWLPIVMTTLTGISFFPRYRYWWIFIGMMTTLWAGALIKPMSDWTVFRVNYLYLEYLGYDFWGLSTNTIKFLNVCILIGLSEAFVALIKRKPTWLVTQYPITTAYAFLMLLITGIAMLPLNAIDKAYLWSLVAVMNHYFWFIAYTLQEARIIKKRNYLLDFGRYLPVWGFTSLPYGKGSLYLQQVEAQNSEEFAVTQLKAIKLGCWALLLGFVLKGFYWSQTYLEIPQLPQALSDYSLGQHYSVGKAWGCVIARFFQMMLELTVTGHIVVATCRMCGFRILRNTYEPLCSKTIAEYWNRYNYYFKELLATFFFYPTYFRFFKQYPRVRILFATMSAATWGNMLFHFILLTPIIMSYGLITAFKGFVSYTVYAIILGISIGFSQLHNLKLGDQPKSKIHRVVSIMCVLTFFVLLSIFNKPFQSESVLVNIKILCSLFNIQW